MFLNKKILFLSIIVKVFAAEFSVVSFGRDCQVNICGTNYPMTKHKDVPLFKTTVDAQPGTTYVFNKKIQKKKKILF